MKNLVQDFYYIVFAVMLPCYFVYFRRVSGLVTLVVREYRESVQKFCGISSSEYQGMPEQLQVMKKLPQILATRDAMPDDVAQALRAKKRLGYACGSLFAVLVVLFFIAIFAS